MRTDEDNENKKYRNKKYRIFENIEDKIKLREGKVSIME